MILNLVKQVLQRLNYSVETALTGSGGIAKFESGNYDLVITDVCMPETDGNRVVDHIRNSLRSQTPVIGMSGTPRKLTGQPYDRVLAKPFQIDSLMSTARTLTSPTCQSGHR